MNVDAQVIENPVFDRTSSVFFHINKIKFSKDSTYLYCTINVPNYSWVNISPLTFVEDDITKKKYIIIKSEGIPFSPSVRNFDKAMKCEVTLVFPNVLNTTRVNLIENVDGKGFNVYGISLSESFSNIYSLAELDRFSNFVNFWVSAGDSAKSISFKKKEMEASRYLFGDKSIYYMLKMSQLSDLCYNFRNQKEALRWKKELADRCSEIYSKLINAGIRYGEKEYYMQDLNLFSDLAFRYYFDNHEWQKAKRLMLNAYQLLQENNDTTVSIPIMQYYIGVSSYNGKDEEDAEKFFLLSYDSFQKHEKAKQFPVYGELLASLSLLYNSRGDYENAYNFSIEASHVCRTNLGEKSKEYGFALTGLSNAEIMLNRKEEGLKHAELASTIIENANDVPLDVKEIYRKRISAIKNVTSGGAVLQPIESNDSVSNVTTNTFEANNDMLSGNFDSAIKKLNTIKDKLERHFESADLQLYIRVIVSLSDCLSQTGKLVEADKVLDDALYIFQKYNVKTSQIRYLYMSKGLLYYLLNNYISSMRWNKMALDLFREVNDKSVSYARLLGNISMLNTQIGFFDEAKSQLDEATSICEEFYANDANNTSDYLTILNNLASNYAKMGNADKATEIYKTIIDKSTSQSTHRIKALAMCNLADIYLIKNDIDSAKSLYEKVLLLETEGYIKDMAELHLVFCYIKGKDANAVDRLRAFNNQTKEKLSNIFGRFTEYEREKYWNQWSEALTILNNLAVSTYDSPETMQMAYDNALYTKSMLVNAERLLGNIVKESGTANETFTLMQHYKEKLSNKGLSKDSINTYVGIISQLEKQIINSIPNFSDKLNTQFKSYADVKHFLSDNDVAIEFIYIPQIKFPIEESELSYGALILTKNDNSPRLISICKEKELEKVSTCTVE
jgi:tetratricopeptide (TPR) repeat protein